MSKLKTGVYMGSTGELFNLVLREDVSNIRTGPTDTHVLFTQENNKGQWIMSGEMFEFERLLDGFEYLGKL